MGSIRVMPFREWVKTRTVGDHEGFGMAGAGPAMSPMAALVFDATEFTAHIGSIRKRGLAMPFRNSPIPLSVRGLPSTPEGKKRTTWNNPPVVGCEKTQQPQDSVTKRESACIQSFFQISRRRKERSSPYPEAVRAFDQNRYGTSNRAWRSFTAGGGEPGTIGQRLRGLAWEGGSSEARRASPRADTIARGELPSNGTSQTWNVDGRPISLPWAEVFGNFPIYPLETAWNSLQALADA